MRHSVLSWEKEEESLPTYRLHRKARCQERTGALLATTEHGVKGHQEVTPLKKRLAQMG